MSQFAISAGHSKTLDAAKNILEGGGNAVDAAIAAYWVSFVSEPCMASAGAGGFAMIHDPGKLPVMLDFFCQTPQVKRPRHELDFYPVTVDFGTATEEFYIGLGAAAVPGAVAGLFKMHEKWATMPMKELTQQAINAGIEGVPLDNFQAYDFELLKEIMGQHSRGREIFFKDGIVKTEGDLIKMPHFSDFLDAITREGVDLFYKGEIAKHIEEAGKDMGGMLTRSDLEHYQVLEKMPLFFDFNGNKVATCDFPSVGGMILALLLKELETKYSRDIRFLSESHFQLVQDVFIDVYGVKDHDSQLAQRLIQHGIKPQMQAQYNQRSTGTSHFSIVDKEGMACALTTSVGEGCGYMIPDTDMQLNNMLGEAALLPGGFHSWTPSQRLRSMMTPTICYTNDGVIRMVTGSGGAGRIPFALSQTIGNVLLFEEDLHRAIKAPRINFDGENIHIEHGFELPDMKDIVHTIWNAPSLYFGGTHTILNSNGFYEALGDQRRDGVGYVK